MVAKKNDFSENFCYHEQKPGKRWYGKTRVTIWKIIKARVEIQSWISGKVLRPGTVSFSISYQWWLIRQILLISASSLPASASSPPWLPPPNSRIQNKVIPGGIGTEMLFSLQIFSSFRCLFVVRFEWDIVLSSSYNIRKAWIRHVMSLRRHFYSPKLQLIYLKLVWIQETYFEFLVLKVEVAWS